MGSRRRPGLRAHPLARVAGDYVSLTKPRIVALLLVTEFLAMVTAAHGWPGLRLSLVALVAGAGASGGAGAVNCWYDRDIDAIMGRTRRRPVPAGRIAPAHALTFGLVLSAAAFALFWLAVTPLAAWLSLAGGLFYVFVYTVWLKRTTAENIVIGGAAGAMPPVVGWAAVTHTVSPLACALFAIVFLWTPPHFWALSLIVRRDYAAVGVPMRPVVSGVKRTRWAILAYSIALVGFSLSLGVWLGATEVGLAAGLGALFLWLAVRVLREGNGLRWARQLFRFSIMYLFSLFLGTALIAATLR
ncbi:MAG TPA: heme o synthase [Verrucomicrobiae bacterium]|nr:heme o synthase [Verrucomicrobiae bacterium]